MGWGLLHLTNSYFVFFPSLKFFHFVLDFLPSSISESDMRERFLQLVFLNPTERVRFDFVTEPEDQLRRRAPCIHPVTPPFIYREAHLSSKVLK
jgi:hypothetical protein